MGNPFSKGPTIEVTEEGNKSLSGSICNTGALIPRNNNIDHEPEKYNHSMTVIRSLNCTRFTAPLPAARPEKYGIKSKKVDSNYKFPGVGFQWGESRHKPINSPYFADLEIFPNKNLSDDSESIKPLPKENVDLLPSTNVEIDLFPTRINFVNPDREISQHPSHKIIDDQTKASESKEDKKFSKSGTIVAEKGKEKEKKVTKRKKQNEDLDESDQRGEIETRTSSNIDKENYSDWEVSTDPFMQIYLDGDIDVKTEKKERSREKKSKFKAPVEIDEGGGTDDDEVEDSDEVEDGARPEFEDDVESSRLTQKYESKMKKKQQQLERTIVEPPRGKGSFGKIQAEIEERKKSLSKTATLRERVRPDFEIMDPGDGEDEWGRDRQLEPPPETVVVPWVPYGWKKVVAEDGTVTYTKPDTVYEKFTLNNLGVVYHEPMGEEEIANYIRGKKEREEKPQIPEESEESTDFLSSTSEDDSENADVPWEEFENSKEANTDPVFGIPTDLKPSGRNFKDETYLSEADENQPIDIRPTERKDLHILGDVVQAFRIENPDKDDEPVDFFEAITKKEESKKSFVNFNTVKNEENIEIDDDYEDDIEDGAESIDEYDDGLANIDKILMKDTESEIKSEKLDFLTYGLPRVEVVENYKLPCSGKYSLDPELIFDDEADNYEDDEEEEDYNDDLTHVKLLKNIETNPHVRKIVNNRCDSDEDIDHSSESESYDSEEDDYEDNVKEDDYNDNIRLSDATDSQDEANEVVATEEELEAFFEDETPQETLLQIRKPTDNFDPGILSSQSDSEEKESVSGRIEGDLDDIEDDSDDDEIEEEITSDYETPLTTDSSESVDYAEEDVSRYGDDDLPHKSDSEDSFEQDHNPTDLLQELELQGDTFDDFEYSLENGTWLEFPYKNPGDPNDTKYEDGERQLPSWYYIKHPAEDDSLMHIRAKLADQHDVSSGPYNPFKVDPPPTPMWVDDTFDLVPEGVQVPDDFFPGFRKPEPGEEYVIDDFGGEWDLYDEDEGEEADGRSWNEVDPDDIPRKRTWNSWRSRQENEPSRYTDEGLKGVARDATQAQKVPKKSDQWQHYRDWLLRQGTKTAVKSTEVSKDTNSSDNIKLNVLASEGKFTEERSSRIQEERGQPRPHYQTWLTKQVTAENDPTIEKPSDDKRNKYQKIQKPTHKRYEEAFLDDKWLEAKQKPSVNMWQHYQKWKQKDGMKQNDIDVGKENVDHFVFSKPPEDINNTKESPYSKKDVDIMRNNDKTITHELSGLDQMRKSHNLVEDIAENPNSTIDCSTAVSNNLKISTSPCSIEKETFGRINDWKPKDYVNNIISEHDPQYSLKSPPRPEYDTFPSLPISVPYDNKIFDKRLAPSKPNNIIPIYSPEQVVEFKSGKKKSVIKKTKVLNRSSSKPTSTLNSFPNVQPKLNKTKRLRTNQALQSKTYKAELDYNLNVKFIDQTGTKDNFLFDISRPHFTPEQSSDLKPKTFENFKVIPTLSNKPYTNLTTINLLDTNVKTNSEIVDGNNISTSIEIKPKIKYTRSKPSDLKYSNDSSAAGFVTATISSKVKHSRRATISHKSNSVETQMKSGSSPQDLIDKLQIKMTQNHSRELDNPTKNECESKIQESFDSKCHHENSSNETHFDANISVKNDSTESNFVDENNFNSSKNYMNTHNNQLTKESASSFGRTKSLEEKSNDIIRQKPKIRKVTMNYHWQHYQTYTSEQVDKLADESITPASTTGSPSSADPQPTSFESKIYPTLKPKPYGDHWLHYKAWLEKNNIQKPLYKSPATRPVMSLSKRPSILKSETTLQPIKENIETKAATDGNVEADRITDEKVEYLHQRWLTWQQNLASKMVNKLNKMLKYYENPEGNITHDTVKVRDMIKQRDYWREIYRWSSKKSFKLYNKTPPQTPSTTVHLAGLNQQRIRSLRPAKTEYHYVEPADSPGSQKYKQWSSPDPEILNTEPSTPETPDIEQIEVVKEVKRPIFPARSTSHEDKRKTASFEKGYMRGAKYTVFKKPKFPNQSVVETSSELLEISSKQNFPSKEINIDYSESAPRSTKSREMNVGQRKPLSKEDALSDKLQDQFFREVSDLLGDSVRIEGKVKTSKSRAEKRLKRRLKAKYQEEKKEKSFKKRYGDFLSKMDHSSDYDEEDYM